MRRGAASERVQFIAALEGRNEAATGVGGGEPFELTREPGVVVLDEIEVGHFVLAVGVKACRDEDHPGTEALDGGEKTLFDHGAEGGPSASRRQGGEDHPIVSRTRGALGVEPLLKTGAKHDTRVFPENVLRPVAMMHVEVDHGDPFETVVIEGVGDANGDIVVEAEAHGAVAGGVMPGRAHIAKGILRGSRQDEVGGEDEGARRAARRLERVRVHRGIRVEPDEPLGG